MRRRRGPRLKKGLPRGGLGLLGWLPAVGSIPLSLFVPVPLAVACCVLAAAVSIWCALGLRKDDAAGELCDQYEDTSRVSIRGLLAGDWEHPVRRRSNGLIVIGLIGLAIALCRIWYG